MLWEASTACSPGAATPEDSLSLSPYTNLLLTLLAPFLSRLSSPSPQALSGALLVPSAAKLEDGLAPLCQGSSVPGYFLSNRPLINSDMCPGWSETREGVSSL